MEFKGQIYNTKEEWVVANDLAQSTLVGLKGYTSNAYALQPIETSDDNFILVELNGFESELGAAGFNFISLDKSIIKTEEI